MSSNNTVTFGDQTFELVAVPAPENLRHLRSNRDPLHVPLEMEAIGVLPISIGTTTSIVGPDGNQRPYMVTSAQPVALHRFHVHLDPI